MSKAILISIRPEWCGMIALGEKTIEVRKTRPKLETPFKCYIYCTLPKSSGDIYLVGGEKPVQGNGRVIGEFICDKISVYEPEFYEGNNYYQDIREVSEDEDGVSYKYITSNEEEYPEACDLCANSCLTFNEIKEYIGKERFDFYFYGWNISNLVIYDKPKDLTDFFVEGECYPPRCSECKYFDKGNGYVEDDCLLPHHLNEEGNDVKPLKRPPQSWCYVEEIS